jgi:hypothetical protein
MVWCISTLERCSMNISLDFLCHQHHLSLDGDGGSNMKDMSLHIIISPTLAMTLVAPHINVVEVVNSDKCTSLEFNWP